MKVIHLINSLVVGGAEKLLLDTIEELQSQDANHEHIIVTLFGGGGFEKEAKSMCQVLDLGGEYPKFWRCMSRYKKLLNEVKPDIVHAHLVEATFLSRMVKKKGVKVLNTFHSPYCDKHSRGYSFKRLVFEIVTASRVDMPIFISPYLQLNFQQRTGRYKKSEVVNNFPGKGFKPVYEPHFELPLKVVSVGNFKIEKGYDIGVKAFELLKEEPIIWDIYGEVDDSEEAKVAKKLETINLQGKQDINSELLSQYDIFFIPSRQEGFPISLLEAQAVGLPTVVSDIPSMKAIAGDNITYCRNEDFEDMAKVFRQYISEPKLLELQSQLSLKNSSNYGIEKSVAHLLKIYNGLIKS